MEKTNNNSIIMAVIALVVFAAIGAAILLGSNDSTDDAASSQATEQPTVSIQGSEDAQPTEPSQEATPEQAVITTAEVALHATADDCWTIVGSNAYDITAYVPRHPGGDTILEACGADGTSLFETRTTDGGETVGSGTPHSGNATSQLEGFLLGPVQ